MTSHGKTGIERVWRVGTGIMLIDLAILKNMPLPWFEIRYDAEHGMHITEDWDFCARVERAGHEIYVDHGLSQQIGHIGEFNYTHVNIPELPAELAAA